jgi:hypothetical protein
MAPGSEGCTDRGVVQDKKMLAAVNLQQNLAASHLAMKNFKEKRAQGTRPGSFNRGSFRDRNKDMTLLKQQNTVRTLTRGQGRCEKS